uniref:Ribonuclease H-like domain-containing protein n=1 Tax=Tanacetum cinerariifolium TaxID=118510 RepID=A0A699H069_TANCI|nr:ribonuclease H-like domain-containing protein [Tanacetum cinerariifolium]
MIKPMLLVIRKAAQSLLTPTLSFMRPFGCLVTIINTIDHLVKVDGKADEGTKESDNAGQVRKETEHVKNYILLPLWTADLPFSQDPKSSHDDGPNLQVMMERRLMKIQEKKVNVKIKRRKIIKISIKLPFDPKILALEDDSIFDFSSDDEDDGYTQEKGIEYDEVFAPVARIEAIRLFLAYASFKDFVVYQMDVKSDFLYGKIEEEVYVCQPLRFEDPYFLDRVYKVEKHCMDYIKLLKVGIKPSQHICWTMGFKEGKLIRPYSSKGTKIPSQSKVTMLEQAWIKSLQQEFVNSFDFWSTAMAKTINGEAQLHALVDGKEIIIIESTVKRYLRQANEEGIDCLPNSTIFETYIDGPKRKDSQVPQPSDPIENVPDEAVHKELGDSLVRVAATASSLEAEQDSDEDASKQGRIDAIDADKEITLVSVQDEVVSNDADNEMFDVDVLDGEEVFVTKHEAAVKGVNNEVNIVEEVVKVINTSKLIIDVAQVSVVGDKVSAITTDKSKGILIEPIKPMKRKDQISFDEEAALKLQATFDEEGRLAREKPEMMFDIALKRVNTCEDFRTELVECKEKRAGTELIQEITKKQKVEDDKEIEELKQLMQIIPDEKEVAIDAIHLSVKPPKIFD